MYIKNCLVFLCVVGLILQQTTVCEANWFTDLFSSKKSREAHATVYGEGNQESGSGVDTSANTGTGAVATPTKHKGSWTHELLAAAAGFEAMRVYERQQAKKNGQPVNHSIVKGVLAGLAAAAVDRLIETKGLDLFDAQRLKSRAQKNAEVVAKEKYGDNALVNAPSEQRNLESGSGNRNNNNNRGRHAEQDYNNYDATTSAGEYK